MALSPAFLDELRARTPLAAVIGRKVKLARSGRQLKGCCPFHGEKTPSFYVYDDHYHCFGCGAHGDAVSFVMQSHGAGFIEAVEQLAAEAGMEVPKPTPEAAEAERRRLDLHGVLEAASAAFQRKLYLPESARALDYLRGRGLSDETIRRFGLGWSGEGRGALAAELSRQEIAPDQLVAAGLVSEAQDDRPSREMFFNRVMFPIRDRRGRTISFGGRIMGDGQPKYLNGPETDLFSKRRTLYGLDFAREAARGGAVVLVVEGYMDVIALHQSGFQGAVAPLGTALTEEQLGEIWRIHPIPVVCFDTDTAGKRAALKTLSLILPHIDAEKSARFLFLYPGYDPDNLLRMRAGRIKGTPAEEFERLLPNALSLQDAIFDLLSGGSLPSTPELRTLLRRKFEEACNLIRHRDLGREYRRALLDRLFAYRSAPGRPGSAPTARPVRISRPTTGADTAEAERGRTLLAILLRHPALLHDVEEAFADVALPAPLARLRSELLRWAEPLHMLDSDALITHLTQAGLAAEAAQALSAVPYPLPACAMPDAQPAEAEAGWWHIFGLMHRGRLEDEVAAASRAFASHPDDAAQRRLIALCTARDALRRGEQGFDDEL